MVIGMHKEDVLMEDLRGFVAELDKQGELARVKEHIEDGHEK